MFGEVGETEMYLYSKKTLIIYNFASAMRQALFFSALFFLVKEVVTGTSEF